MTTHRATCTDCPWSIEDEDLLEVSDEMEDHGRKEQHDVELQKAVATDGGTSTDGSEHLEKREVFRCTDCGDFELEKKFSGIAGTPGEEEYNRTQAPECCPVCGGKIRRSLHADSRSSKEVRTDGGREETQYYVVDEDRAAVVAGPFDDQADASDDADDRPLGHIVATERVLDMIETASSTTLRWETDEVDIVTDGGEQVPFSSDWQFDAVVFGTDARMNGDCLALTSSGKPCTYNAYGGDYLCGTHQRTDNPTVVERAHQWARITDDEITIAVCLNCEEVWQGGAPPLGVECPSCDAGPGERCQNQPDRPGSVGSAIPPHNRRRHRAQHRLDRYGACREGPTAGTVESELITDGGTTPDEAYDDRYEETCEHCGTTVEAFTRGCPGCGFRRDTFEQPDPASACIECGEPMSSRCGCCGFPLCGKHHELGGGFCRSFTTVGGTPVCVHDHDVYVGVWPRTEHVLTVEDSGVYHLPKYEDDDCTAPLCRPSEVSKDRETLDTATDDDRELCTLCERAARDVVDEGGDA